MLTCAFDVTVDAQTAYYYENETFDISDGAAGRKLDLAETGTKRKSFDLDNSYRYWWYCSTCRSCYNF